MNFFKKTFGENCKAIQRSITVKGEPVFLIYSDQGEPIKCIFRIIYHKDHGFDGFAGCSDNEYNAFEYGNCIFYDGLMHTSDSGNCPDKEILSRDFEKLPQETREIYKIEAERYNKDHSQYEPFEFSKKGFSIFITALSKYKLSNN